MPKVYLKLSIPLLILFVFSACEDETLPKPKAFLRLSYDLPSYQNYESDCPYTFEYSELSEIEAKQNCWLNLNYPTLKASVNITYRPIQNNLRMLLLEAEKLTYNHSVKADGISAQPFVNFEHKKYGGLSEVTGNAASALQFHLTDSTRHFITGSLYFKVKPNYDSILPAIKFIEKDISHLMESLIWKNTP